MAKYVCPFQHRQSGFKFLLCEELISPDLNLKKTDDALKAYCAHQEYCTCSNQMENSDDARQCYAKKSK